MAGRVIVIGGINTDLVVRARVMPRPGETLNGDSFFVAGGGKGANAAVAAARQGGTVAMVGCVGSDDFGTARLADLQHEGIDSAMVQRSDNAPSGVALIIVDASGQNSIVVVPGANALVTPEMVATLPLDPSDLLLLQLETSLATVETALRRARASGARTVLNAAPFDPAARDLLPLVDLLIVNELEGADLLEQPPLTLASANAAVAALLARGVGAVALTLGAHGAVVGTAAATRHLPAPAVTVVDTTAAGDAFVGTLATGLAAGDDLFAAASRAVIAGSLATTKPGAQPSLPYRHEVEQFTAGS